MLSHCTYLVGSLFTPLTTQYSNVSIDPSRRLEIMKMNFFFHIMKICTEILVNYAAQITDK